MYLWIPRSLKPPSVGLSLGSVPRFQYSLQKATEQSVPPALAAKHGNLPCAEWWRKTSRIWKLLDRQLGDICWTWLLKFAWCLDGLPVCLFCCKSRWLLETNIYNKYIIVNTLHIEIEIDRLDSIFWGVRREIHIASNNMDWHSPWVNRCYYRSCRMLVISGPSDYQQCSKLCWQNETHLVKNALAKGLRTLPNIHTTTPYHNLLLGSDFIHIPKSIPFWRFFRVNQSMLSQLWMGRGFLDADIHVAQGVSEWSCGWWCWQMPWGSNCLDEGQSLGASNPIIEWKDHGPALHAWNCYSINQYQWHSWNCTISYEFLNIYIYTVYACILSIINQSYQSLRFSSSSSIKQHVRMSKPSSLHRHVGLPLPIEASQWCCEFSFIGQMWFCTTPWLRLVAWQGFSKPPFGGWLHFECVNVIVFRKWYPHMSLLLHWKPSCCCWSLKPVLVEAGTWRRIVFFSLWWEGWWICGHPTGLLLWRSTQGLHASYGRCSYGMGFPFSLHTWIRRCQGYRPQLFIAAPFRMNRKLYWIWVPKISGGHIPQFLVIAQVKGVASGKCLCSWWRTWRERSSYQISVPTVQWLALAPKRSTGKRPCWLSSRWIFDILRSEVFCVLVLKCWAWLSVWDRCLLPFWLVPSWDEHTVLGGDIPLVNG